MKGIIQILVCCFANITLAMCSSQSDGDPVIYIVDYGGLPWKFVVTNNVAEIRDASYDNRRVSLYNYELYTPAIPRSTPGKITTPSIFFDYDVLKFRVVKIGDKAFRGCTNISNAVDLLRKFQFQMVFGPSVRGLSDTVRHSKR